MPAHTEPQPIAVQEAILRLLRGEDPGPDFPDDAIEAALRRYECGGYLHGLWSRSGRNARLPPGWAAGLARAHRRTLIDNLAALAEFRTVGCRLIESGVPFLLLKGASYLVDLYEDPGGRMLTDVDLVVRREDVKHVGRLLARSGFAGIPAPNYPEFRRFAMVRPGDGRCQFEFHWWVGLPARFRVDQRAIWERSTAALLEGVPCRRLAAEDALLYHVAHQSDHYFGPTLKWLLDLRQMFLRWPLRTEVLASMAAACGARTALHLALRHLERVIPGVAPAELMERLAPGRLRRSLLARFVSQGPLEMLEAPRTWRARYALRVLLIDDAAGVAMDAARALARPLARPIRRALRSAAPPWEGSD